MAPHSAADERQRLSYLGNPSEKHVAYPIVFWQLLSLYSLYVVSTFALYLYYALRVRDYALLQRSPYLLALQTIFGLMYCINALLRGALGLYPCFVQLWLLYIGYVCWTVTVIIAMLRYYVLARSHSEMGAKLRQIPVTPENLEGHLTALLAACGTDPWQYEMEQRQSTRAPRPRSTSNSSQRSLLMIESDTESRKDTRSPSAPRTARQAPAVVSTAQPLASELVTRDAPFAAETFPSPPQTARLPTNEQSQQQCAQPITNRAYSLSNPPEVRPSRSRGRRLSAPGTKTEVWRRRLSSNRFISYTIVCTMLAMVILLLLMNIFSPQMSLRPVYYNCFKGWEYTVLAILAGVFNTIICPAFVIMTWTYKDGYGIRRSLSVGSVTGLLLWVGSLVWRLIKHVSRVRASPSLFYVLQILLVYSITVVSPLYVAWQNANRQKTQGQSANVASRRGWSWSVGITERKYDLSKQSFMAAMQDAEEHDSIEQFAGRCFCAELVSFLDVYLALKMNIYKDIRQHGPSLPSAAPADSDTPARAGSDLVMRAPASSTPHTVHFLDTEGLASGQPAHGSGSQANLAAALSDNLASLSSSITATMTRAFPEYDISDDTLISERLRDVLKTIVRTFMLPESPLAINVPHAIVSSFRAYLLGSPATFGMVERVKEEVINLLYSNVYIRYRQV
ncbi:hypothetical protein GGH95_000953 [Coemansia sp. RSA 1836]|nr:hypothetical protein GGH95_000953 [Coemansia sp. RSA 1836]